MKKALNIALGVLITLGIFVTAEMTLGKYFIDNESCIGCGICVDVCPQSAITSSFTSSDEEIFVIDAKLCDGCGLAKDICPADAIIVVSEKEKEQEKEEK